MRILVADNDVNNRSILTEQLTNNGHSVIEAINDQCFKNLQKQVPRFIANR